MGLEEEIKKAAKEEGADLVGFAPVNTLSSKLQIEWAESAVVIGVAVGGVDNPDDIAYRIAIYLQGSGLKAEVIASSESRYDIRPLAVEASLGSRGKNGLVITPEFGPRVRFSGVITNAIVNSHKKRIRDFCNGCNLCVERCPVNAIGEEFDIGKCEEYNQKNTENISNHVFKNCMICAKVCPVPK